MRRRSWSDWGGKYLPQAENATAEHPRGPLASSWEATVGIWKVELVLILILRLLVKIPCNSGQEASTTPGSHWRPSPPQEPPEPLGGLLRAGEEDAI